MPTDSAVPARRVSAMKLAFQVLGKWVGEEANMENSDWLLWRDPPCASMPTNPLGLILILLALTFSSGGFAVEYTSPKLVEAVSARDHDRVRQLVPMAFSSVRSRHRASEPLYSSQRRTTT